ncbi:MAG TPA: sigma-70 family RNA polymerase sigma factor [Blastocatellia bacterium]
MASVLSGLTVIELLHRCAARPMDEDAWQEFVCRYHATIRAFVTRTFQQRMYAEPELKQQCPDVNEDDLVQVVYAKLVNDPGTLERFAGEFDNSIFQYLGIIATNVVRDHFRTLRAGKRPRVMFSLDQLTAEGDRGLLKEGLDPNVLSPDLQRDITVTQGEIEEVLYGIIKGRNGARDILIFKLRFFDEMGPAEIVRALGGELTAGAVSSIINRAVLRIRPILASKYGMRVK